MIRKFAPVPCVVLQWILLAILAGTVPVHAQESQAQQPAQSQEPTQPQEQPAEASKRPSDQQSSSQQASVEEATPLRKNKPKGYKNWTYNIGGGASLTNGNTQHFVRGGGGIAAVGVTRNANKYLGLRLDFQFDNLPLRSSALQLAQAPGATDHVYTLALGPIINIPVTKNWGGYIIGGAAFYHRSGKLDSSSAIPGSACNNFFQWWGHCFNNSLPIDGNFLHSSLNQIGEDFGGGITRKIRPNIEMYAEFRYLHGKRSGNSTDLRPITVGIRW